MIVLSVALMTSANLILQRNGWGSDDGSSSSRGYSNDDYSQPIPYSFGYDVKDDKGKFNLTN